MKIHKNDKVLIRKGKYRGKIGKVLKVILNQNRVIVEGVNIVKKHTKPRKSGEKGKVIEIAAPINIANTSLICPKCKKATKINYKIILKKDKKIKVRICKKCGKEM